MLILIISQRMGTNLESIIGTYLLWRNSRNQSGGHGSERKISLMWVLPLKKLPKPKRLLNDIDLYGPVVVTDTLEVIDLKIGNQPHW